MKRFSLFLSLLLCVSFLALAAGIDGKWTAQVPGRQGQARETTFTFKAEGEKLTGTMSGRQGDIQIADGVIKGNEISFTVTQTMGDNQVKRTYTGTLAGDEIKMKRDGGQQGQPVEFVAKRAQ